jgi:uncharacterized protein (TIGR03435 family)
MKKWILSATALALFSASALFGQNFNGTWQGTLKGPRELRIVIKISIGDDDKLKAELYSIDQPGPAIPVSQIARDGSTLKMTVVAIGGNYEGKMGADGDSITGTWTQGASLPLNLVRATPETAWAIPEPPPPPKVMAANADPAFEVSTIKPSRPEGRFSLLVNRSGMLNTTATSLSDLIKFAYGVHPRQITGGPDWIETEKYDVTAKPDTEGIPNVEQLRVMMQKLLADRFQLSFHRAQRELSVYAITVIKSGHKLSKNESGNALPGFGGPPRNFSVRNATMAEFAGVLQANILERPVVDQTGLGSTRFDFILKWTPDPSQGQVGGSGPDTPPRAPDADAPPDLFTAFQQQLGLKLESTKASVDVLVIDKFERPSEN